MMYHLVRKAPSILVPGEWGLFALVDIPKDSEIIEYKGKIISTKIADKLDVLHRKKGELWIFAMNDKFEIDASRQYNLARYINHSSTPNCISTLKRSKDGNPKHDKIIIESLRDIKAGEELSYDYMFTHADKDYPWYSPSTLNTTFKKETSKEEK
jgi:SET domain-containing protein